MPFLRFSLNLLKLFLGATVCFGGWHYEFNGLFFPNVLFCHVASTDTF